MKDIIVEFSGWVRVEPTVIKFVWIGDETPRPVITGEEWQALSLDNQGDWVLESVLDACCDAEDGGYEDIQVYPDS